VLVLRNELQQVIERLAQSDVRVLNLTAPASGFVQPDHIKISVPVAFGIDAQQTSLTEAASGDPRHPESKTTIADTAKSEMRFKIEAYHEGNPPPAGVMLGAIEIQFVIASKR
jgi:hypothetical protein